VGFQRSCKQTTSSCLLFLTLLAGTLIWLPAGAQVAGGTLSGTVTDTSGAVIPRATISIRNPATSVSREVTTDSVGFYAAPNLLPGVYEVATTAPGFATVVQTAITLTVGALQVLNITMQVGQVTEKVQVTGAAPEVQLATSSISAVVNSTTIQELPLNGRSWTDLANLQPGVAAIQTQASFTEGPGRGNRGFGAQITIDGARPQQNNYRLDGVSLNDYANGAPGSVLGGNLGVDAIQEFSVLTSNYSAEYGKTSGGVVNAITRSGTNQFHGIAYEFLRNSALDARNFFDQGSIPPFKRNQFGAGAGGPIRKDRTFVFGDYEGIRQSKGITSVDTVPSLAARAGNLSTGTVRVDPSVQKYLALYHLPNGPILPPGDKGIFTFAAQQVINENFLTFRIDHKFSEKDSLFGTYLYDDSPYNAPDNLNDVLLGSHTNRQFVVLEENHILSPSVVNSVRFGFNREGVANNQALRAINPAAADPSLAAVPGTFATGISASGISTFMGGLGGSSPWDYGWNSFQVYDDAFLTRSVHSVKFGVAFERMQMNLIAYSDQNGSFHFGSLTNLLTNKPQRFLAASPGLLTPRGIRQSLLGGYVQDDWRWRPNLTLNLGLRYEMTTVPTEVQGKLSNLVHITDAQPHLGDPFFSNPTLRNFEPRLGFAWDPFRNGKTAVRGAFGVFDVLPLP
jgi:outer membrane receptor protein involved in Fe transport